MVLRFKKAMQMTIIIHGLYPDADLIVQVSEVYCKVGGVSITPGVQDPLRPLNEHILNFSRTFPSYARVPSHVWTRYPNGLASGDRTTA